MEHGFFGGDKAGKGKRISYFPFYCQSWIIGLPQNSACMSFKEMLLCTELWIWLFWVFKIHKL